MTTLHKLSIRGVRSYSPDSESIIKFQHPLTIIVGANGSGKTSIIECLKYVCSGEFPPLSDKGKSFVHDPDSCGEPIVKGQIKLAFKTAADKNVIAIKSFQVTAQKGRRTFKLIDSVLSATDEQGQQKTVSYKCARMDDLMTQLMGVTTPILENVIFCHQLDADWPLSDDKSLKKRFDDIFSATKYTRALESIKKIRSEQLSKCKDLQRDLDIIVNNLETVQKVEADKARIQQALEMLTTKWEAAQRQKEIYSCSFRDLSQELSAIENFENKLATLHRELQTMEQEVAQARKRLQIEFTESTPELIQRLSQFSEELDKRKFKLNSLEKELNRSVRLEEEISGRYQTAVKAAGKIEFLEQQLSLKLLESCNLIETLPDEVRRSCSDRELQDSGDITPVLSKLSQFSATKHHEMSKRKIEHKERLSAMEKQISDLNQQLQNFTQTEQLEKRQLVLFSTHISNLDIDLTVTTRKRERLLPLKQQAEQAQLELDGHLKSVAAEQLELKIEQYNRQLQDCNNELFNVNTTLHELQSTNEARNRVAVRMKLYDQAKDKFEKMKKSVFPTILNLLGPNHPLEPKACLQLLISALDSVELQTVTVRRDERKNQDELLLLRNRFFTQTQQLEISESQLAGLNQQIATGKITSLQQVDDLLRTRKLERDRLDHNIRNATEFANLFADWGAEAEQAIAASQPHSCGLCDRSFSPSELQSFVARNAKRVLALRSPEELQSLRHSLQQVDRRITKLEQIRCTFEKINSSNSEISAIRFSLKEIQEGVQNCEETVRKLSKKSQDLEASLKDHRQAQNQLESLRNCENETLRLEADLKQSEKSCKDLPVGDSEEMQRQCSVLQSRSQQLYHQIDDMRQQMLSNDEVTRTLREKAQHLREEAAALARIETKIEEIVRSVGDYENRREQAEITISQCRESSIPIQKQLQSLVASKEEYESELSTEIRSLEESLSSTQSQQRQLQTIGAEIQQISKELQGLRVSQESITRLNCEAQNARSQVREVHIQLQTQRDAIAAFESDKRSLQDNIEYRERLGTYEKQLSIVEKLIGDGSRKCRDREIVKKELEKSQKMLMECDRISASSQGERSAFLSQLQSFESTLAEERYHNIATKYRHAMIDLESTKMMVSDLDQYYRALDKSLMDFHSIKMSEINQVLKELWQCTYRGNDIDAIAVRSDHADGAADLGAGRQRKHLSYSLSVVPGRH